MDFISIIIPAFNAERWIEKTLRSVSDAIDSECEVIVVNDGSSDSTHDIARSFADADPRFTLIDIKHVGPSAARRAGFLESQGDYIVFVDSDDLLPSNAIAEQRRLLDEHTADNNNNNPTTTDGRPQLVIANTVERYDGEDKLLVSGQTRALSGLEYAREILTGVIPGFMPGHFISRQLLESIDWDDSPEITHQENYYILLSCAMKLYEWDPRKRTVLLAPTSVCYYYMRRAGSQSALMALTPKGLERVWNHLGKLGLPEPEMTLWGLEMLNRVFVERGIPFPNNYPVALDLRNRARLLGNEIPQQYIPQLQALASKKRRTQIARELARKAGLTSIRPHLSVVIICNRTVKLVERTVNSVYAMGFRNLEVIIVDLNCSHRERVALNNLSIRFARVRVVRADDPHDMFRAALNGLDAAQGLSVAFARPGDLCCADGLYEAVTRIDYGADVVLPNFRVYYPLTHIHGTKYSYSPLRSTDESRNATHTAANTTEDVYKRITERILRPGEKVLPVYFAVWRTDFLRDNKPQVDLITLRPILSISHAFLVALVRTPMRVVTQDKNTPPAFEYAKPSIAKRLKRLLSPTKPNSTTPTTY